MSIRVARVIYFALRCGRAGGAGSLAGTQGVSLAHSHPGHTASIHQRTITTFRTLLLLCRLVSEQYLDPTLGYVAAVPSSPSASDPLMIAYRTTLQNDYNDLRVEYDAML